MPPSKLRAVHTNVARTVHDHSLEAPVGRISMQFTRFCKDFLVFRDCLQRRSQPIATHAEFLLCSAPFVDFTLLGKLEPVAMPAAAIRDLALLIEPCLCVSAMFELARLHGCRST